VKHKLETHWKLRFTLHPLSHSAVLYIEVVKNFMVHCLISRQIITIKKPRHVLVSCLQLMVRTCWVSLGKMELFVSSNFTLFTPKPSF
jgi:hypothetical protein